MSRSGKSLLHLIDGFEIDGSIFAYRGVRTASGFDADDAIGRQRLAAREKFHVFAGEDVVGDHAQLVRVAHRLAEAIEQRRFTGADRAADANL